MASTVHDRVCVHYTLLSFVQSGARALAVPFADFHVKIEHCFFLSLFVFVFFSVSS